MSPLSLLIGLACARPGMSGKGLIAILSSEKLIIAEFLIFPTIAVTERRVNALI